MPVNRQHRHGKVVNHAVVGDQYTSLHQLLGEFASYSARARHVSSRPSCRPDGPANARSWWLYAGTIVREQTKPSIDWNTVMQARGID